MFTKRFKTRALALLNFVQETESIREQSHVTDIDSVSVAYVPYKNTVGGTSYCLPPIVVNLFYIFRAVPFLTLWLPSRHSPIRELPFWTSLFLSARVAVLDVDVRIMTSSVMAQ